jgi:hypothetical protein
MHSAVNVARRSSLAFKIHHSCYTIPSHRMAICSCPPRIFVYISVNPGQKVFR